MAAFCGLLLLANVAATKPIALGAVVTDGGALLFPATYVLGDVLAEVYGLAVARRAIVCGFILSVLGSLSFWLVDLAPPAAGYTNNEAFHAVLGFVPRIVAASLVGYLAGQLLNARVLVGLRDRARPGSLWFRLLGSTAAGGAADTVLFCVIAFGGILGLGDMAAYIATGYVYKLGLEVVFLPLTTRVIARVKRSEADGGDRPLA
ncbi:MAG: queuosine precursor transporter [Propionibacteriaceae bacterium]|nr:queuosine precursor transporter [Propionibacteriaceae bacterium]